MLLLLLSIGLFLVGKTLELVPWYALFEYTLRLLALLALGPHMYWVRPRSAPPTLSTMASLSLPVPQTLSTI